MFWKPLFAAGTTALCALGSIGCVSRATNLVPGAVPEGQGAMFGRIEVLNERDTVTGSCYLLLSDELSRGKVGLSLDDTGWVFTAVRTGPTFISTLCTVGGLIKHNAVYEGREISVDVPGGGKMVYFGHVRIQLNSSGTVTTATALGGPIVGAIAEAAHRPDEPAHAEATDKFEAASDEYRRRYGALSAALKPYDSFQIPEGRPPAAAPPRREPPLGLPEALGFVFGTRKGEVAEICKRARRDWSEDGGHARCGGIPGATGMAGCAAQLDFADDRLSAVELVVIPPADDAKGWAGVFRTVQAKLVDLYGKPAQRGLVVPDECKAEDQFLGCVGQGKVTGSTSWSLADGRSVALAVAGGSPSTIRARFTAPRR